MIPTVTVSADINPDCSIINPGNVTKDQVFLLSVIEANQYFNSNRAGQCEPTDYAFANGVWEGTTGYCFWWLRSPGNTQTGAAGVGGTGDVIGSGNFIDYASAVRPALWIDLNL